MPSKTNRRAPFKTPYSVESGAVRLTLLGSDGSIRVVPR